MSQLKEILTRQLAEHPIDFGTSEASAILEFLYIAYCESRESDPPETRSLFAQLGEYLEKLPLDMNNAMFFIIIKLCTEHERRHLRKVSDGVHSWLPSWHDWRRSEPDAIQGLSEPAGLSANTALLDGVPQ